MSLMAVYLFCVAFGAVLIAASLFLGGHDADADLDADADVDLDADADADADLHAGDGGVEWSVLPFGSLRFWTFLVEGFGLTGALLHLVGVPAGVGLALALATGLGIGWVAFHFFRWLAREEVSGEVGLEAYVDHEARVVLPVRPGRLGKIAVQGQSGRVELLATTRDPEAIGVGQPVLIVAVDADGRADVTSLREPTRDAAADRARRAAERGSERQL